MKTLADRIRDKRKELKFSQAKLAELVGMTQGSLSHLESGRNETSKELPQIAQKLGVTVEWLLTGKGDITTTGEPRQQRKKRYIPIKGTAQMGDKGYWTELDNSDGYLEVSATSSEIYAIRAIGESMYPAIRAGWYVVFDKNKSPMSGEYVHILLQDGRNMIKEFISNQNGILSVMSVNGMERMSFPIQEVLSLNAFIEIQPPSGLILEIPEVFEV